ncbi:hypothetical protein P3S67_018587 [Capsicum chacoense]
MIHFRRFVSGPSGRMSWIRNGPESLGAQNIIEAIDNRNNLRVAKENNILYIAFPAISYGSSGEFTWIKHAFQVYRNSS